MELTQPHASAKGEVGKPKKLEHRQVDVRCKLKYQPILKVVHDVSLCTPGTTNFTKQFHRTEPNQKKRSRESTPAYYTSRRPDKFNKQYAVQNSLQFHFCTANMLAFEAILTVVDSH